MGAANALAELIPDRAFAAAIALSYRRIEPELGRLRELVAPTQTAVDVGGWYGPWTYWLARRAARVVTVEPNPELARFVRHTAPANVTVVNAAASDRAGSAELWLPPGGKGSEGLASLSPMERGRPVTVQTIRVDDLELEDVGLVKVDVEGHERPALLGAEQMIRRWRPTVIVEIETEVRPAREIVDLLAEWGYVGSYLQHRAWHPLDGFDLDAHQRVEERPLNYVRALTTDIAERYVNLIVFRPR